MSGPKVVRIVTHEEIMRICAGHLARVDAASAECERILARNGLALSGLPVRRARLDELLRAGQHVELQKQAPLLIEWIHEQMQSSLEQAFSAQAVRQRGRQNLAATAASLLRTAQELPPEIRSGLQSSDEAELSRAVSRAFALLAEKPGPADDKTELRDRLRGEETTRTLDQWLDADPRFTAAERQLCHLEALTGHAAVYREQLALLKREPDPTLKLDALTMEIAGAVRQQRELLSLREAIAAAAAELKQLGHPPAPVLATEREDLRRHLAALEAEKGQHLAAAAAESSRQALLQGLKQLGYRVNEGMATVWAAEGKLIVQHPDQPAYPIELAGRGELGGKLQIRTVATGEPSAPQDREAEVRWCGDLDRLQGLLTESGSRLTIEKATPAGAQPLKRVLLAPEEEHDYEVDEQLQSRWEERS